MLIYSHYIIILKVIILQKGKCSMKTNLCKVFPELESIEAEDKRKRFYIAPTRIVKTYGEVKNPNVLLNRTAYQATLSSGNKMPCIMKNSPGSTKAGILLDYGREIHGCVRISVWSTHKNGDNINIPFKALVRHGESISEAITPLGTKNARNDHAIRDSVIDVPFMSAFDTGETGFRYLYFELQDEDITVNINSFTGVLIINDYPWLGSFDSDDELLNRIWKTSAYTVQLNIQHFFWDGIKRDRLVWLGDMNTEICTAYAVFGDIPQIRDSLDFGVNTTPLPEWMNTIPSYSCWWLMNMYEMYMHTGDSGFILKHKDYIRGLVIQICALINENGLCVNGINTFVDWSTKNDESLKLIALNGVVAYTLKTITTLLSVISADDLICLCHQKYETLKSTAPKPADQKIASALLVLGGLADAEEVDRNILSKNGAHGYSTFMGHSILNAKSLAGNIDGAIEAIKQYWGGMLEMGATTFWEDFDIEWMENAITINEFPVDGKKDIHGDYGKHCYTNLRHSLCHGWASGPCPWLTENILGVHILEPGMKKLLIKPYLGDMTFVSGSVPSPFGIIKIKHKKDTSNKITTEIDAPKEIEILIE